MNFKKKTHTGTTMIKVSFGSIRKIFRQQLVSSKSFIHKLKLSVLKNKPENPSFFQFGNFLDLLNQYIDVFTMDDFKDFERG